MRGVYRFFQDGELIAESRNLITAQGRQAILRYLTGRAGEFANVMLFGIGDTIPTVDDTSLRFEFAQGLIDHKDYSLLNSTVTLRGTLPETVVGEIREVGISAASSDTDLDSPSQVLTRFDDTEEGDWTGVTITTDAGRIGNTSLVATVPAGGEQSIVRSGFGGEFSTYADSNEIALAFEVTAGSVTEIEVRLRVDAANYYAYTFAPTAGYNIVSWPKSAFVATGTPDWDLFDSMEILVRGTEGAEVAFDGMRIDNNTQGEGFEFVSRSVLTTPITKTGEAELQVEYVLDITI